MAEKLTVEQVADQAQVREEAGMRWVTVRALINGVRDNGRTYAAGETFEMEISLVPAHVAAGQVELVTEAPGRTPSRPGDLSDGASKRAQKAGGQ